MERHALAIYMKMDGISMLKGKLLDYFNRLPDEFDRKQADTIALNMNIHLKSSEKYLEKLRKIDFLSHEFNIYKKQNRRLGS